MNHTPHRPDSERLSRYLDGDAGADEARDVAQHLRECAGCRAELEALRELVARSAALPDRPPARDPWPALAERLSARPAEARGRPGLGDLRGRRLGLLLAFAAGVLLTLGLALLAQRRAPADSTTRLADARFLLLLHQPAGAERDLTPEQHAALVERYRTWAEDLGERCLDGEELAGERWTLRSGSPSAAGLRPEDVAGPSGPEAASQVAGYFVLRASGPEEALRLARDCPHVHLGGWIEVRPIRENP